MFFIFENFFQAIVVCCILYKKIEEYTTNNDSLEEVFENKEQIEVAKYYERLPKSTLIAVSEFLNDRIYYRNPNKENGSDF